MKIKYTYFFPLVLNLLCIGFCQSVYAGSTNPNIEPKIVPPANALTQPTASLAAYSGLGAAAPGDYASTDVNPAIMSAFKKQYLIFGDTFWQHQDELVDFGVLDNASTSVATLVRVRESVPNDSTPRDRRFTLGFGYQIPKSNLSLGVSFDYEQLTLTNLTSYSDYNYFGSAGFLYEYVSSSGRPFFIGAGVNKILDAYNPIEYDTGISTTFLSGFYAVSLDALTSNVEGLDKVVASLDIVANQFLDLKGSYGYQPKDQKGVWGAGIFFHAPVIQLFYTFASSDSDVTTALRQTAGAAFNFVF